MTHNKSRTANLILLLALSVFAWAPLLHPAYFFQAHDARHSIFYLVEFDQTLRDGYLWPRWSPDFAFGYGYPLFNLYAPLAIYAAEIVHLLGVNMIWSVKTIYILSTIGAGVGMYGFTRRLFGENAGLVAGLAYMYAPFHLVEIFVRSAYAEYVSLMLLPLVLWAFTELIARPSPRRMALAGASYGVLALTHHSTFFTFTPFLLLYIFTLMASAAKTNLRAWGRQVAFNAGAGVLGVLLAGVYIVPVLLEQKYIKIEQWTSGSYNFAEHFVYFSQFLSPFWGYGYAGPGPVDFMPYQIGIAIFGLAVAGTVALAAFSPQMHHRGTMVIFVVATLFSIWLMSPLGENLWHALPIAALVQFPWRLLIITMLSAAVVIGGGVAALKLDGAPLMLSAVVLALASYGYAQPQYTSIPDWADTPLAVINWDAGSIADRVGMVAVTDEQPTTSPMEAQYRAGEPLSVATVRSGNATVETIRHGGASDTVKFRGDAATVQFYTYDFPGWQVKIDGQIVPHRHEPPFGLITVDVPAGEHIVSLRMGTTPARTIGGVMSLLALAIIGYLFVKRDA